MIAIDDESLSLLIKKAASHGMEKREKETLVKNAGINSVDDAERHLNNVAFSKDTVCFHGANDRLFLCNKRLSTIGVLDAKGPGTFLIVEEKKYDNKFEAKLTKEQSRFEELGFKASNVNLREGGGIKSLYPDLSDKGQALPLPDTPQNKEGLQFFENQPKEKPPLPSQSSPRQAGGLQFYEDLNPNPTDPKHKI